MSRAEKVTQVALKLARLFEKNVAHINRRDT